MTQQQFIDEIAKYVQKYAPQYGILVCSPIIAQACLESAYGTSELAVKAPNNFCGLKYKKEVSENPAYVKEGSEQNPDGTYVSSTMLWCSFSNMDKGVEGYFKFLFGRKGITRYDNLKGITDPQKYLETIKADGYATSINYVKNNMAVINKWNLTKYDNQPVPVVDGQKYYRVQVGAYSKVESANAMMKKLKDAGFSAIIKNGTDYIRVQVGAYRNKSNAEDTLYRLKQKGFEGFITYG